MRTIGFSLATSLLALAFGASGLMMARPTLAKSGAAAASAATLLDAYEIPIDKMLSMRRRGCPGLGRGFACRCGSSRSRGRRWSR